MNDSFDPTIFPPLQMPPPGLNPFWWPINPQQQAALHSPAEILLYGGGSGGGKSDFLVADAAQEYQNPNLRGLLLRKSFGEMPQLYDRMEAMYKPLGARYKGDEHTWIFPSGARIRMGYLANEKDIGKYRGNTFSWLGIDEVGEQPESRVRKLIPWLASTDPTLRVRIRLTSNPGGEGMAWLPHMFLRGKCPVHNPCDKYETNRAEMSVYPGRVYSGSRWRSDNGLVNKTTSFIPALAKHNPLYDQRKIDSLLSQTLDVQEHLLHGCWCKSEGMYFDFLRKSYVKPYHELEDKWWWNHFISIDYGYGNSSASAGLYCVNEAGTIYKIAERLKKSMASDIFIQLLIDEWIRPVYSYPGDLLGVDGKPDASMLKKQAIWMNSRPEELLRLEPRRIVAAFIDPANDNHDGTGQSNKEIMQEPLSKVGISLINAHKDRVGNAQQTHRQLRTTKVVICDSAPHTYDSLSTRMVDEKKSGDVKKRPGDPLDDVYDETSYAINTWPMVTVKTSQQEVNERIAAMAKSGVDERSLLIHRKRIEQEQRTKKTQKPIPTTKARFGNLKRS